MKPSHSSGFFKPFKNLKVLIEHNKVELKPVPVVGSKKPDVKSMDSRQERAIFNEAMADVKKISRTNHLVQNPVKQIPPCDKQNLETESLEQLKELVKYGTGFIVSLTPEYIEGTASRVSPEVARRLHQGYFSIQSHIDLHGLGVDAAHEAFDGFLNQSILADNRAVLIIHGRGLSSPAGPVLKTKVYQWLTTSPWNKWVIAFTSARLCDGGAGATYVLLRQRPFTKRTRRNHQKK